MSENMYHCLFHLCCTLRCRHHNPVGSLLLESPCRYSSARRYRRRWSSCHRMRSSWLRGRRRPGTGMEDRWHLHLQPPHRMWRQRYRAEMKCAWWSRVDRYFGHNIIQRLYCPGVETKFSSNTRKCIFPYVRCSSWVKQVFINSNPGPFRNTPPFDTSLHLSALYQFPTPAQVL